MGHNHENESVRTLGCIYFKHFLLLADGDRVLLLLVCEQGLALCLQLLARTLWDLVRLLIDVSNERLITLDGSLPVTFDCDVGAGRVELTVAFVIVEDPGEDGLASGNSLGKLDVDGGNSVILDSREAGLGFVIEHDPLGILDLVIDIVCDGPLAVSTFVGIVDFVLGLDSLALREDVLLGSGLQQSLGLDVSANLVVQLWRLAGKGVADGTEVVIVRLATLPLLRLALGSARRAREDGTDVGLGGRDIGEGCEGHSGGNES